MVDKAEPAGEFERADHAAMTASRIRPTRVIPAATAVMPAWPSAFIEFAAQALPQPAGDLAEGRFADDGRVALARPAGVDDFDETARARRHGADTVGQHGGFVERVGDQQHGGVGAPPQPQDFVAHEQPCLRVKRAERLVEKNKPRLQHQRARDANALAHTARQLCRIGTGEILQPHECQRIIHAPAHLVRCDAAAAKAESGVVPHRQPGKARVFLKDDADALGDLPRHRLAFERHGAGRRLLQAG